MMRLDTVQSESIASAVARTAGRLSETHDADAQRLAEWLVSHVAGVPRYAWLGGGSLSLTAAQQVELEAGTKRLAAGEPLPYVIGETPFMDVMIRTDRRALIPRPETEFLVERVLAQDDLWARPQPVIADIGTGSGCMVIALAQARPHGVYVAVDRSADALELARSNAQRNGVADAITWLEGDLLAPAASRAFDAVVANLPYIATGELARLPRSVRDYEPWTALDGGKEGLDLVYRLIEQGRDALKPGGQLILEIGAAHGTAVKERLEHMEYVDTRIMPDRAGRDRIAWARTP